MMHLIKRVSLGLLAVLVVSAVGAPAASAEGTSAKFTAQDGTYPETVHGVSALGTTKFTTEAGSSECVYTAHGTLNEPSQTLLLKPTTTECKAFGFLSATVTTEGCSYLYHVTTKTAVDKYQAHVDLTCPAGQSIKITSGTCKVEIKPQTGLTTVDFENMTASPSDLTMTDTVSGVAYTVTQDGFGCSFAGTGNKTGATFTQASATTFTSPGGIHIG
jgi:hypothetical protein